MVSFSWMYATAPTSATDNVNVVYGSEVRVLIPEEFGGGAIEGEYCDYGLVKDADGTHYDLYELLALWNSSALRDIVAEYTTGGVVDEVALARKACDNYDDRYEWGSSVSDVLRVFAIDWSHLNDGDEASDLHYGLKLVRSDEYGMTYENCRYLSAHDSNQGVSYVRLGNVDEHNGDLEEAWLKAVHPPVDRNLNRSQLEELPIDAEQRYKLEKVLVEGSYI